MPILNYTTEVTVDKTVNEIYRILTNAKAKEVTFENKNGIVSAIKFVIDLDGQPLAFRLEPNPEGVLRSMIRDKVSSRYHKHAIRVAWRIIKNAVDAQMAIVMSQQADLAEVFLPYALNDAGVRFYPSLRESRLKQLTAKT